MAKATNSKMTGSNIVHRHRQAGMADGLCLELVELKPVDVNFNIRNNCTKNMILINFDGTH